MNISTPSVVLSRFAGSLYGLVLNNSTLNECNNIVAQAGVGGMDAFLNAVYMLDFATKTTTSVATTVCTNLGLTGADLAIAENYVAGQLNAVAANARGAVISAILSQYAGLASDPAFPTYNAVATAWEAKVSNAVAYSQNSANTTFADIATLSSTPPGQTFVLTTAPNTFTGGVGNDIFDASTTDNSLSAFDTLNGGGGTNSLNASLTGTTLPGGLSIQNIQTASLLTTGNGLTANTTAWTGLANLTVIVGGNNGATDVTAAKTTALSITGATDTGAGGLADVTVVGGGGALTINAATANGAANDVTVGGTVIANAFTSATITGGAAVAITDHSGTAAATAGTLTTVSLDGNDGAATITSDGLTTLTVKNAVLTSDVTVTNTKAHALALALDTDVANDVTDVTATSIAINATGADSDVALCVTAATAITAAVATGVVLTLDATVSTDYTALTKVTVTGAGDFTADFSNAGIGGADAIALTTIDASALTGAATVTIEGTNTNGDAVSVKTGAGADTVTISATTLDTGSTLSLGDGSDTVAVTGGGAIGAGAVVDAGGGTDNLLLSIVGGANVGAFKNFENFDVVGLATSFDQSVLDAANTVSAFIATGAAGGDITLQNLGATVGFIAEGDMAVANVVTLTQATAGTAKITTNWDGALGDGVQALTSSFIATNATAATVTFDNQNVDDVANTASVDLDNNGAAAGTGTIKSLSIVSGGSHVTNTLVFNATGTEILTAVTITGTQALVFDVAGATTCQVLASVDASGQTAGGLTFDMTDLTQAGLLGATTSGTLKLGAGDDTITTIANTTATSDASIQTKIATITGLEKGSAENLVWVGDGTDGYDTLIFAGAIQAADAAAGTTVSGLASIANGLYTFTGAGAATLTLAITQIYGDLGANDAVVFSFGSSYYIYGQGGNAGAQTDDLLVKLTGVTSITGLDTDAVNQLYVY
jgi:hypothetical protein